MTTIYNIYANVNEGGYQLHIAQAYSKGIAYIIANAMTETYKAAADTITVQHGTVIEYALIIDKAKEAI